MPALANREGLARQRNNLRAEGPVSCLGFLAGTDGSGLQPSNRFNVPIRGAVPQAGMVRTFGAGEGGEPRMDADGRKWEREEEELRINN